jgi:hypothetical protein
MLQSKFDERENRESRGIGEGRRAGSRELGSGGGMKTGTWIGNGIASLEDLKDLRILRYEFIATTDFLLLFSPFLLSLSLFPSISLLPFLAKLGYLPTTSGN